MADKEDKPLPPVFHGDKDKTNANQISGRVIDPFGFEKHYRTAPDGSVTRLDTKGGRPQVTVTTPEVDDESKLPRGLCAYPVDVKNSLSWSKPCVIKPKSDTVGWRTVKYNPAQTKKHINNPPAISNIKVTYWTSSKGNTCLACNDQMFYGRSHLGSGYNKWRFDKSSSFGNPLMPFISDSSRYFFSQSDPQRTSVIDAKDAVVFDHYATRDYGGETGVKAYDIQLPMSVTTDGDTVLMQSASDLRWGNVGPGSYDAVKEKAYWLTRLDMPTMAASQQTKYLPSYGYFDGTLTPSSHSGSARLGVGDCEGLFVAIGPPGSAVGGYFFVGSPGWPSDEFWIPKHYNVLAEDEGFTSFSHNDGASRDDVYFMDVNQSVQIGSLANGLDIEPVSVHITSTLSQSIHAEGNYTYGSHATTISPNFHTGETNRERKLILVSNPVDDKIKIDVSVGTSLSVTVYEHTGSGSGNATYDKNATIKMPSGDAWVYEGYPSFHDTARIGGSEGDGPGSDDGTEATLWHIIGGVKYYQSSGPSSAHSAISSWPTFVDAYNLNDRDGVWHENIINGNYSGNANFSAVSRTILAADAALSFVAYVEVSVSAEVIYSAPPPWKISLFSSQMVSDHIINAKVIVQHKGVKHTQELFSMTVSKIGIWDRQEIEDWYNWPWTSSYPDSMYLVAPPRMWPDASKMQQVDNIFQHQGINSNFAGIPESESIKAAGGQVIFSKRFRLNDSDRGVGANWILDQYGVTEIKRGAGESSSEEELSKYYYCPALEPKIEDDWYQVEFDQDGLRAWVGDIPAKNDLTIATRENREAICYRV